MGDIGSIINNAVNQGQDNLAALNQKGYSQFQAQLGPQLNMGAYGANQAANAGMFNGADQAQVAALQSQAAGTGGPNLAQNQLRQGQQGNLAGALAAAASQRGNQNPGAMNKNIQENQAAINAGAAGQAGNIAAKQQLDAQGQLSSALNNYGNQQIAQAGQQNNVNQNNSLNAQAGNAAQQAQFENQQALNAAAQAQTNSSLAGFQSAEQAQNYNTGNAVVGGALNAGGGAISNALSSGGGGGGGGGVTLSDSTSGGGGSSPTDFGSSATGTGGPTDGTTQTIVGEEGPEIAKLAPGSEIVPLDRANTGAGMMHPGQHQNLIEALTQVAKHQHDRISDLEMALKASHG